MSKLKIAIILLIIVFLGFYVFLLYDFYYGDLASRFVFWNYAEWYLIENPLGYILWFIGIIGPRGEWL